MSNSLQISAVHAHEYQTLLTIWEASVRATHDFLSEDDIQFYRSKMISDFFPAVNLQCARDAQGKICGFIGTHEDNVEMLFIAPESRGQGIGRLLLSDAILHLKVSKVDVNEQNNQAYLFYERLGFRVVSRSALDGMGKPFPLLHMALAS